MEGGDSELYYQTRDGTRFYAAPPDPEEVGLDGFHAAEERAIGEFLADSEGGVLVMGGVSHVGKSYLLRNLAQKHGLNYFDLQSLKGRDFPKIYSEVAMREFLSDREIKNEGSKVLFLDEGLVILEKDKLGLIQGMEEVIDRLLQRYSHIVLAGGSNVLKSEMQSACLDFALPFRLRRRVHSFHLKRLNTLQIAQVIGIECARSSRIDPSAQLTTDKIIDPDIARIVAELTVNYFRLMRPAVVMGMWVSQGLSENFLYNNLQHTANYGIMPQNCFKLAWEKQEKALASRRDELMSVIERNGNL